MTAEEFYEELAKTEGKWEISFGVSIRQNLEIIDSIHFCPITAVCLRVTKEAIPVPYYKKAGRALKLHPSFITRVVNGSDSELSNPIVRRKLLKALGL